MTAITISLFSYGTLQQAEVQKATYGRLLEGGADQLPGYRLEELEISDPEVVRLSGLPVHTIARFTGNAADTIPGTVYKLTEAELQATDRYEVDAYARLEVRLASGISAFVYVARS